MFDMGWNSDAFRPAAARPTQDTLTSVHMWQPSLISEGGQPRCSFSPADPECPDTFHLLHHQLHHQLLYNLYKTIAALFLSGACEGS